MSFVHDSPDFAGLLEIVGARLSLAPGLVEKDYWVTHALWSLHQQGLDVWFKGGTSLSKGYGIIQRFSEDLDLKLLPGTAAGIPSVTSWKSEGAAATAERKAYFEVLESVLSIPGTAVVLDREQMDRAHRSALLRVLYPGQFLDDLGGVMRPFVLLEVDSARVTPAVSCDMSSFVHDYLIEMGALSDFTDNRPRAVRCVHPLVTLLEKLDAISRRFSRAETESAAFIRHYEDAARIIRSVDVLPPIDISPHKLAAEMVKEKQLRKLPSADDPAFQHQDSPEWQALRQSHAAIQPMFWGERVDLGDACLAIREWVSVALLGSGASPERSPGDA